MDDYWGLDEKDLRNLVKIENLEEHGVVPTSVQVHVGTLHLCSLVLLQHNCT